MGFFDRKAEQLSVKLIFQFTGELVNPRICVPCEADGEGKLWRGYCVLTNDALFLVNKYGAKGVKYENVVTTDSWGQYPQGSTGYPTFRFGFAFKTNTSQFTIFSKTESDGQLLSEFFSQKYNH